MTLIKLPKSSGVKSNFTKWNETPHKVLKRLDLECLKTSQTI